MFKATKRTLTALVLLAAASSPSAAFGTFDQHPPASSTRATTLRASPAVNPCSGPCTAPAYGSPRGTSWQQAEKVAALAQTVSPSAPGSAVVVARCLPIPRGVCLPSASVQSDAATVVSVRPTAPSSQKGLQWDNAAIVAAGMLLLLAGACTAAIFTRRRHHRTTAS